MTTGAPLVAGDEVLKISASSAKHSYPKHRAFYVRYLTDKRGATLYRFEMVHEFLTSNRKQLITRCREKVANRLEIIEVACVAYHGETLFQSRRLIATLKSIVPWPVCDMGVLAHRFSVMPDNRWDSTALSSPPLNRIARVASLVPNLRRQLSSRWQRKLCFQQETV